VFWRLNEGNDFFLRLLAALNTGQCQRSPHQLQELPPGRAIGQPIRVLWKLTTQRANERLVSSKLLEAAPELQRACRRRQSTASLFGLSSVRVHG
jgi:hypothetical protein